MFLTIENLISMALIFGGAVAFLSYRAGRSDQRDADIRAGYAEMYRRDKS